VGDHVFFRVTSTSGIIRAIKFRKLTPRFIGQYQITTRISPTTYENWFATSLGKLAQCLPCITIEEVHCRPYSCTRGERCAGAWGFDSGSWTSEDLGFSSQATRREGDPDCEGSLRWGNSRDDVGDGRSHETVLSAPISRYVQFSGTKNL